jgi:hypothetical protein
MASPGEEPPVTDFQEMRRTAEKFGDFAARYGFEVTNALRNQARHMSEAAAEAGRAVEAAEADPAVAAQVNASMVTVYGYQQMAEMFTEAAAKATRAADAWEKMTDPDDEDEEEVA